MDPLLTAFAHYLGLPPETAAPLLAEFLARHRTTLHAHGTAAIEGVGVFRTNGATVQFEPTEGLLGAVNRSFAGLPPVAPPRSTGTPPEPALPVAQPLPAAPEAPLPPNVPLPPVYASLPAMSAWPDEEPPADGEPVPDAEHAPPAGEAVGGAAEAAAVLDRNAASDWLDHPPEPIPAAPSEPEQPPFPEHGSFEALPDDEPEGVTPPNPASAPSAWDTAEPQRPGFAPEDAGSHDDETPAAALDVPLSPAPEPTLEAAGIEAAPDDPHASLDADLDALLAGVWATAGPPDPNHPLGPASAPPIEDAEYDVLQDETRSPAVSFAPVEPPAAPPRREDAEASPVFAALASGAAPATPDAPFSGGPPKPSWPSIPILVPPPEQRPTRRPMLPWLPLVLAAVAVGALLLWPRGERPAPAPTGDPVAQVTPEVIAPSASGAGGLARRPAADSLADDPQTDSLLAEPSPEGTGALPPDASGAMPSQPAPAATPRPGLTARPQPVAPLAAPGSIPAPLRGPGRVDPARGGVAWVIASVSADAAGRLAEHYRRLGYRMAVIPAQVGGRTVYRVVMGQFADHDEARRYRGQLPAGIPDTAWLLDFSAP